MARAKSKREKLRPKISIPLVGCPPEMRAALAEQQAALKAFGIRHGLTPERVLARQAEAKRARKRIDRAIWAGLALPQQPTRKAKKKRKLMGAPREYDHAAIRLAAEDFIRNSGLPRSCNMLMEKVEAALGDAEILAPGTTQMRKIVGPVFKRAQRKKAKRHTAKLKSAR